MNRKFPQKMITQTNNLEQPKSHRHCLCRFEGSAILVDSQVQAYIGSWFTNPSANIREPG